MKGEQIAIKSYILNCLIEETEQKLGTLKQAISDLENSRNNETKSSVGDKYETSRAMAQNEIDKYARQLAITDNQLKVLKSIDIENLNGLVKTGSLVKTNKMNYFISISYGKITYKNEIFFAISPQSPIGKLLLGKRQNDIINFRNSDQEVVVVF